MTNKSTLVTLKQNHMATTFEFSISCGANKVSVARQVLRECQNSVHALEEDLSEFLESSSVAKLNRSPRGTWIAVSDNCMRLLECSDYLKKISDGAFDCTAKSKGFSSLEWDWENKRMRRLNNETRLSFGAIGKGYALDKAAEKIEQEGFTNYLLVAGGSSIRLNGFLDEKIPWSWGWRGKAFFHTKGTSVAIGVSGNEEQGAHIINPKTGDKVSRVNSALVAHPSAAYSDALSTALFVLDWEKALTQFNELIEKPALAIFDRNEVGKWNGSFQNLWGAAV